MPRMMKRPTLFTGCRIYGLAAEGEIFSSMMVGADGRIVRLIPAEASGAGTRGARGSDAGQPAAGLPEGAAGAREDCDIVDLGGKIVVPAFTDAHSHFMPKVALSALAVRLGRLENGRIMPDRLEGLAELLLAHARTIPRGPIFGYGAFADGLAERRLPTAAELDAWLPGRVVAIFAMDGHSSAYSTPAQRLFGFEKIARDGLLTGEAHEFNMGKVTDGIMKSLSLSALARGFSHAVGEAARSGLSTIHCLEGFDDAKSDPGLSILGLVAGHLQLRLKLYIQYTDPARLGPKLRLLSRRRVGGCLAWEMDGSISSRSAALERDYLDRPGHRGELYRSPDEAYGLIAPFVRSGYQTSAHAIGTRAIESVLSACERVLDETGDPSNAVRLRIEHFELPRPDQVERAGRRRIVTAVQPGFLWADSHFVHSYDEALDAETRELMTPLKSMHDAGCVLALSTDAPVQDFDPFVQIAGAVDHPFASERLTVYQALRAYSFGGAYAVFEEDERGTLEPGKFADFAVLDEDPFEVPRDRIHSLRVRETWVEGRRLETPPEDVFGFAASLLKRRGRKL